MKLSSEQAKQLQEKLAAEKNPEEAAKIAREFGIDLSTEDAKQMLENVSGGVQVLSDDVLKKINGGEDADIRQFEIIKEMYHWKGPKAAFITCLYFIPSPLCYEIIEVIEEQEGPPRGLGGNQ